MSADPIGDAVRAVVVRPGDTLVIGLDGPLNPDVRHRLAAMARELLPPSASLLLVDRCTGLAVWRAGEQDQAPAPTRISLDFADATVEADDAGVMVKGATVRGYRPGDPAAPTNLGMSFRPRGR